MRSITINNVLMRFTWLKSVLSGEIVASEDQLRKLVDMKRFCELEVVSMFGRVSYNTLKSTCLSNALPGISAYETTQWEHIKELRKRIHETYSKPKRPAKYEDKPNDKVITNEALNQAQLASIAYLELFGFLKGILESDNNLHEAMKQLISNFLYESNQKFESITSFAPSHHKKWSVIKGGRTDG